MTGQIGATVAVLLCSGAALVATLPFGEADNGDFTRFNQGIVTEIHGDPAPRPQGREEWRRSWNRLPWNRYWTLAAGDEARSARSDLGSVRLLWIPGVWLNRHLYDAEVLDLRWLSFLPRLLSLVSAVGLASVALAVARRHRSILLVMSAAGWSLLITSARYTSYFNSFYRETACLVFAGTFLLALALRAEVNRLVWLPLLVLSGSLLVSSAPAHAPLTPVLMISLGLSLTPLFRACRGRQKFWLLLAGVVGLLTLAGAGARSIALADPVYRSANVFNAIFTGLAPHSRDLMGLMSDLELPQSAIQLVGRDAFEPQSKRFRAALGARLDWPLVVRAIRSQPRSTTVALLDATTWMNRTSLLGHRLHAWQESERRSPRLWNAWGEAQALILPSGSMLVLLLALLVLVSLPYVTSSDLSISTPAIGTLFCSLGVVMEIVVKLLGDGTRDKPRQLLLANFLLGACLLMFAWLAGALWARRNQRVLSRDDEVP